MGGRHTIALGIVINYGHGVDQDYDEAFRLYHKPAYGKKEWTQLHFGGDNWERTLHARSQYGLGNCYYYGHGVQQNYAEAFLYYGVTKDNGSEDAKRMCEQRKLLETTQLINSRENNSSEKDGGCCNIF